MSVDSAHFAGLPAPEIIETLSFEEIRQDLIDELIGLDAGYSAILESDPGIKILEAVAYRELVLRQRFNDGLKANFLPFAHGANLEHHAAFYGVARLPGELDKALFERVVLAIAGRSPAGPEERYMSVARGASVRVKDVAVTKIGGGPQLEIAILATDNGGIADAPLLAAVTSAVNARDVRAMNDVLTVVAASYDTQNVAARVWLLPDAPQSVFDGLEAQLRAAWAAETGIGFDLNLSWLAARLHAAGVSRVEIDAPAASRVVAANRALALGTVTLTLAGRSR